MDLSSARPSDRNLAAPGEDSPAAGAARPLVGDGATAAGTSGAPGGTNGGGLLAHWRLAALAGALAIAVVVTVNALSRFHDQTTRVQAGLGWTILADEYSAGFTAALLAPFAIGLFAVAAPVRGGWRRFALVQVAASLVFGAVHVTSFVWLRKAVYGLHGLPYRFGGPAEFLYEYRKDALAYAVALALAVLADALLRRPTVAPGPPAAALPADPAPPAATFAIQEGARTLLTPVAAIVAATAAGNYVEFQLADGRRPLMRTTLAAVEAELGGHGLVRTHRSWLVNAACVREIAPTGSGDRRLTLDGGGEAPLSRRYETALERLRG